MIETRCGYQATPAYSRAMHDYVLEQERRLTVWHQQMHMWQRHGGEYEGCLKCFPKYTKWQKAWFKVKRWWRDHYPRVHFGPCDEGDEY